MATGKMSTGEKKLIKTVLIFVLVQIIIALLIVKAYHDSQPINIKDTKQIDIIVDDTYYLSYVKHSSFHIYSDNVKYSFENQNTAINYSSNKLDKTISAGDRLTISYIERWNIHGTKWVVDARSGNKVYRTLEEYNKQSALALVPFLALFAIIEIVYLAICTFWILSQKNNLKTLIRRIKKKYGRK